MNRPIEEISLLESESLGWKLLMFARELQWGVFTVDFEGSETLAAAARDQATAIAIAPAISSEARHVRIRRLR